VAFSLIVRIVSIVSGAAKFKKTLSMRADDSDFPHRQ
jgi:hypothetical protein